MERIPKNLYTYDKFGDYNKYGLPQYWNNKGKIVICEDTTKQIANAIYDSHNYIEVFEQDLVEAEKKIIISSPVITLDKIERLIYLVKSRQEAGVSVVVKTTEPDNVSYGNPDVYNELVERLKLAGIIVKLKEEVEEHFAVIDDELVWHGGMNLLGKEDTWDNLMRIKSHQVAAELLEIAWGENTGE